MNSVWTETANMPHFETLEGEVKTDVLIIGGGITGLLCAYFLKEQGVDYLLAEGRSICSGVTKNTTAKISAQHGLIYGDLLKKAGEEKAKMYLDANQKAVEKYFALCKDMDCDFEERTNYVYSVSDRRKLEQEVLALKKIGFDALLQDTTELPFSTVGAVGFAHQAQFHPLKFLAKIAEGLNIYENTFVTKISENTALTEKARINFERVIFATHFPIDNKHGMYFLKMYQNRSYVIALENAFPIKNMYVDEDTKGLSFRGYENLLLLGGGSHRTGKQGGNWQELRDYAGKYYPRAKERYYWATQDCMPLDNVPYIGVYAKSMPQCLVATGYHKWGMTTAMAAAMLLTDKIMGKENPYEAVFCPSRSIWKPQLFVNGGETIINLLTPTTKRCPHLGCALKWNKAEHSWDCPCHGSRFAEDGGLIDNPANGDWKRGCNGN
ncbi:MAG: FAD-dependent oxidoreductase [Lachnospiraceae bacterium]|nr:FAD-dependent oxidoreductase [Lachnospiraceae bacterium]